MDWILWTIRWKYISSEEHCVPTCGVNITGRLSLFNALTRIVLSSYLITIFHDNLLSLLGILKYIIGNIAKSWELIAKGLRTALFIFFKRYGCSNQRILVYLLCLHTSLQFKPDSTLCIHPMGVIIFPQILFDVKTNLAVTFF